jgi:serine-type D-Ala-D-Ala carboxypeptidase
VETAGIWRKSEAGGALVRAIAEQGSLFAAPYAILQEAISERVFPAASVAITHRGRLIGLKAFGRFTFEADALAVASETLFDLASLTKVVATTATAMVLYERGVLDLEAPVAGVVPEFVYDAADSRRNEVTLRMLLTHSSGLPAYEKLFLQAPSRVELLAKAFALPLACDPGSRAAYSDIGFIILGVALERLADEPLDRFCQREIFAPLGMKNTAFNPPKEMRTLVPPTADDRSFRQRVIQGEVQDENASVLGGVAGHAGAFSTAEDLAIFAQALLRGGAPILRGETVRLFTRREDFPKGTSRALGWDTPSAPSQSGKYFGSRGFGHLGYTGTSLWIDPEKQLSVALLTNRTWPDCSNDEIRLLRPRFHDAVMEAVGKAE